MPRLGKKTLYLDLEALERMQEALNLLPGKPSLSSYLNEILPGLALQLEEKVKPFQPAAPAPHPPSVALQALKRASRKKS